MAAITRIEGIDEVIAKITTIEQLRGFQTVMLAIGTHIKGKISPYPPETEANSPREFVSGGKNTWYQRGYGSKWARKDGSVGGRKTSEQYNRQWTIQASATQVIVGNKVPYGPYLQSEENQAAVHKRNGWKTDRQVATDQEPVVRAFVEKYIEEKLR